MSVFAMPLPSPRRLSLEHAPAVLALYRRVAAQPGSGLARAPDEMSLDYFQALLSRTPHAVFSLGIFERDELIGEIHASRLAPRQFAHVLTDLTVAVAPGRQGQGIGARLFALLFAEAERAEPPLTRIELFARSGNAAAIALYERLGFVAEGRFVGRVVTAMGVVEDDIPMARTAKPRVRSDGRA